MKKRSPMIAVSICVLMLTMAMTTMYVVSPNPGSTTVSIYPATITGPPLGVGDIFSVNINIADVTDLYTYTIGLSWNPQVLECQSWTYNKTFFSSDITIPGVIDNIAGKMDPGYGATLTGDAGVTGSGTLADVKFRVIRSGKSWINITACDMFNSGLSDISRDLINGTFLLTTPCGPTAVKTHMPTSPRVNQNVTFDASSSLPGWNGTHDVAIANYTWDFGDGTSIVTKTDPFTTHNYTADGTYTVNLTVMCVYDPVLKGLGLTSNSTWQNVTIRPLTPTSPMAKFSYAPMSPRMNQTVSFDASSSLPGWNGTHDVAIANYTWDFGDGTSIVTKTNPFTTHNYTADGTYTVNLTVMCQDDPVLVAAGLTSNSTWQNITIRPPSPISTVSVSPASIVSPPPILRGNFTVYINIENVTDLYYYRILMSWNPSILECLDLIYNYTFFPAVITYPSEIDNTRGKIDGFGATLTYPPHEFGVTGSGTLATVKFRVLRGGRSWINITACDLKWYDRAMDEWYDIPCTLVSASFEYTPMPPVADFTYSPLEPSINEPVTFNASASDPVFGEIVSYAWDFGDGSNVTTVGDLFIVHNYTAEGTYTVTLNVTDSERQWDTLSKNITVFPIHDVAVKSVTPSPIEVTVGGSVTIIVVVKNNGSAAETFNVTVYYNTTAIYTQTVTNLEAGDTKTLTFTWNTTGVAAGNYVIKAVAETVTGETNTDDNTFIDGTVVVKGVAKPPEGFPWIIVVVVVIVVIVVVAYMVMRRRPS